MMTRKNQDIFGKIDALLERRDADILGDKLSADDDFPRLTEVIDDSNDKDSNCIEGNGHSMVEGGCLVDRRNTVRRKPQTSNAKSSGYPDEQLSKLLYSIEQRFSDLISRQHLQLKKDFLEVIREELSRGNDEHL